MITIRIAGLERQWSNPDDVEESWLREQIGRRRDAGEKVCVTARISTWSVNVALSTPNCPARGGGGRRPNSDEQRIVDLWAMRGLNDSTFAVGQLVAFLHQLDRVL